MRVKLMGILNVSPDSFYDGGKYVKPKNAVDRAWEIFEEGGDILDIGGESSRPGSEPVSVKEELRRVMPVLRALSHDFPLPISIDTYKPEVAERAIELGVSIINDIYGMRNQRMREIAANYGVEVIVMHMKGEPKTMQKNPIYENVVNEINQFFQERIKELREAGVKKHKIILDPGIGFGKKLEHNLQIIANLKKFRIHGCRLMLGPSRKSFVGSILNKQNPEDRLYGTLGSVAVAVEEGVDILRVHDIRETKEMIEVMEAIRNER